jgi:hypothetical protein
VVAVVEPKLDPLVEEYRRRMAIPLASAPVPKCPPPVVIPQRGAVLKPPTIPAFIGPSPNAAGASWTPPTEKMAFTVLAIVQSMSANPAKWHYQHVPTPAVKGNCMGSEVWLWLSTGVHDTVSTPFLYINNKSQNLSLMEKNMLCSTLKRFFTIPYVRLVAKRSQPVTVITGEELKALVASYTKATPTVSTPVVPTEPMIPAYEEVACAKPPPPEPISVAEG